MEKIRVQFYLLFLSAVFLFISGKTSAQSELFRLDFEVDSIALGDKVHAKFWVSIPSDKQVVWNVPELPEQFTFLDWGELDTLENNAKGLIITQSFYLGCYKDGKYTINPISLLVMDGSGTIDTLFSESISGEIISPEVNLESPFRDIESVITPQWTWEELLPYVLWVVLLVLLLLSVYLTYRFLKNKLSRSSSSVQQQAVIPPHQIALMALKKLNGSSVKLETDKKPFYTELSSIIRKYLEDRFGIEAEELATSEILRQYSNLSIDDDSNTLLKGLLKSADLVKFAKANPDQSSCDNAIATAIQFVELTAAKEA
jgi:hypothetical protein